MTYNKPSLGAEMIKIKRLVEQDVSPEEFRQLICSGQGTTLVEPTFGFGDIVCWGDTKTGLRRYGMIYEVVSDGAQLWKYRVLTTELSFVVTERELQLVESYAR